MAEVETLKAHIDAEDPELRRARAAKKLTQGMYVCAKVAKLHSKYGVKDQVFTPVNTSVSSPKRATRLASESIPTGRYICGRCRLPFVAKERCQCKALVKRKVNA